MDKILRLLIEEFLEQKPSAEYQLALHKFCEAETEFMKLLDDKQKAEYFKFDFEYGKLDIVSMNAIAEFIFENLKR